MPENGETTILTIIGDPFSDDYEVVDGPIRRPEPPIPDTRDAETIERTAKEFRAIMAVARGIAKKEPAALVQLVALLGRKIQADYIDRVLITTKPGVEYPHPADLWFDRGLPLTRDGQTLREVRKQSERQIRVRLASDPIWTAPWCRQRLINTLSEIGKGRPRGKWQEDRHNHFVVAWLPIGIACVGNGFHSITTGIALGQGTVRAEEVYDISAVYRYVKCNGVLC